MEKRFRIINIMQESAGQGSARAFIHAKCMISGQPLAITIPRNCLTNKKFIKNALYEALEEAKKYHAIDVNTGDTI